MQYSDHFLPQSMGGKEDKKTTKSYKKIEKEKE